MLRKWGVRYIMGEWLPEPFRPSQAEAAEEALDRANEDGGAQVHGVRPVRAFNEDTFLDGRLRRVFRAGRFDLLEVSY